MEPAGSHSEADPLLRHDGQTEKNIKTAINNWFGVALELRNHPQELDVFRRHARLSCTSLCKTRLKAAQVPEALQDLKLTKGWELKFDTADAKYDKSLVDNFVAECDVDDDKKIDLGEFLGIVNYSIVKEVKQFIDVAEALIVELRHRIDGSTKKEYMSSSSHFHVKQVLPGLEDLKTVGEVMSVLECLWGTLTQMAFLRWFEAMDTPSAHEDRIRMLNCLLLTVPFRDNKGKWRGQDEVGHQWLISFGKLNGDRMRQDDVVVLEDSNVRFPLEEEAGSHRAVSCPEERKMKVDFRKPKTLLSWVENYLLGNLEEKYVAAYTTVDLFSYAHLPFLVHAIEASSVESEVFGTPIVSAILSHGWQSQSFFYIGVICDVAVICMLSGIALDKHHAIVPAKKRVAAIFLLSFINFFSGWVEFVVLLFARWQTEGSGFDAICFAISFAIKGVLGSFWCVYEMVVSTWFIVIMVAGMRFKWDDLFEEQESRWLHDHAIWVEGLLFLKITHVIIQLMCIRVLGQRVVPAYHALTHLSSRALLFFLFLMFGNAVLTFHAVPIDVYDPDEGDRNWWDYLENVFDTLILQFRSTFLADFSPDELEGEEQRLRLRQENNTMKGQLSGPSQHTQWHHGVQTTNVLFIILIHIMLLNVYIGVLSEQYSIIVKREREHFEKFRAIFTRKLLLRTYCCAFCRRRSETKRTWIAYKSRLFKDPFEVGGAEDPKTEAETRTVAVQTRTVAVQTSS